MNHNEMPVNEVVAGHCYEVADFRGRYVSIYADSMENAVQKFVSGRTCNYDTPHNLSVAWRASGCPSRNEWMEMQNQTGG